MRLKKISSRCEYTFIHKFGMIEGFRSNHYNTYYSTYYKTSDKVIGYDIFYDNKTFHI